MLGHFFGVNLKAGHAVFLEVAATVAQQLDRLQQVMNDHRFVDVQLQVALACGKADGDIIAHYLAGQHRQRFALGRVDLAWHDRAARLIGWQFDFGQPGTWARAQQAEVIGQFHQGNGQGFECTREGGQWFVT